MGLDSVSPEPAGQPEAVAAGLEGHGDARDSASRSLCLSAPAIEQIEEGTLIRLQLLERLALDTWHNACDEPARQAHLDNGDQRRVHVEGRHGSAQVVWLALLQLPHGGSIVRFTSASMDTISSPLAP
jgi:hypothetical protein